MSATLGWGFFAFASWLMLGLVLVWFWFGFGLVLVCLRLRWHPRVVSLLQASPLCGAAPTFL
ncbi:hypothetical protein, partial [Paraburkholderia sp. XV]|uniref:hypothetical protein n=1 Tax=Paraburkholderia sp. XV TaxID=2831520 RepID=UPI001CD3A96B